MLMFCTECGNKIEKGVKFCTQCGAPTESTGEKAPQSTPAYTYVPEKTPWQKFLALIYPKVRQDKAWHRLIFIFGWIISVVSVVYFPITFAIYFGVIQRVIFFIVYGEDKSKWLIKS